MRKYKRDPPFKVKKKILENKLKEHIYECWKNYIYNIERI